MKRKTGENRNFAVFKRWTRKSFAVFNSLKKVIKISALSVSISSLFLPKIAGAQHDTLNTVKEYDLDSVEIVDSSLTDAFEISSQVIQVVTSKDLKTSPVLSIQDVLEIVPEIDVRQRGGNDIQADISIGGSSFDQVLIMLNGINITNPQTGHHNLDLPVSLSQIERVEILNGAGSQNYGANAYSGAINFVTENSYINKIEARLVAGSYGFYNIDASVNIAGKKQRHFIAFDRSASSGYIENTDFKKHNIYYNGRKNFKNSFLEWQLGGGFKSFGANSFYTARFPNQYEETGNILTSLSYRSFGKTGISSHIYWTMHSDKFELFRDMINAPSWYKNHNYHLTGVAGTNNRFTRKNVLGITTLGFDIRYEHIAGNVLGLPTGDTVKALFYKDGFYTRADSRTNFSVFTEHKVSFKNLNILLSLTANTNTAYKGKIRLYPGLNIDYRAGKHWLIKAYFNRSLRLPTFTDLYYSGPANTGNPELKPEEAINVNASLNFKWNLLKSHISFFSTFGNNSIDWVRLSDTLKWKPMNVTRVVTTGFYLSASLDFSNKNIFINKISVQYIFINKNSSAGEYQSHYVMDYLRDNVVVTAGFTIYKGVGTDWFYSFKHRNGNYLKWDEETGKEEQVPYGHYNIVDARIYWKHKRFMIFTDVKNILNVTYYDYGNVPQPGRWFYLGVKYKFEK